MTCVIASQITSVMNGLAGIVKMMIRFRNDNT